MLLAKVVGTVVATRKDERLVSTQAAHRAADRSVRQTRRQLPRRGRHRRRRRRRDRAHRQRQLRAHGVGPEGLSRSTPPSSASSIRSTSIKDVSAVQLARVIGDVVATIKDAEPRRPQAARAAAGRARSRSRSGRTLVARRRGGRRRRRARVLRPRQGSVVSVSARPSRPPTRASSASSITGIWSEHADRPRHRHASSRRRSTASSRARSCCSCSR